MASDFETWWNMLSKAGTPLPVPKWSRDRRYREGLIQLESVTADRVVVHVPTAQSPFIQIPKLDFSRVFDQWNGYKLGVVSRSGLSDLTHFSTYIVSILKHFEVPYEKQVVAALEKTGPTPPISGDSIAGRALELDQEREEDHTMDRESEYLLHRINGKIDHLATKEQVAQVEGRVQGLEGRLEGLATSASVEKVKSSLTIWIVGVVIGAIGVLFTALQMWPPGNL